MPLVLDASVSVGWAFQPNPYARHVFALLDRDDALVPSIWPTEVANAIISAERGGRLDSQGCHRFLALLRQLDIVVEMTGMELTLSVILDLARAEGLTAYDASYLELARREGVALATLDNDLRAAATRIGVPLIEEPQPDS